jgi:hypothetical protein
VIAGMIAALPVLSFGRGGKIGTRLAAQTDAMKESREPGVAAHPPHSAVSSTLPGGSEGHGNQKKWGDREDCRSRPIFSR